jgi:hypothetical protein
MPSGWWLKLYTDILYDPKMLRLTNVLWRRAIECFLMAKELNAGGRLPALEDMAVILRPITPEALESDLIELQRVGILGQDAQGWRVSKFDKRQAPMPDVERKRLSRARATTSAGHESVTKASRTGHADVLEGEEEEEVEVEERGRGRGRGDAPPFSPALIIAALADLTGLDQRLSKNATDLKATAEELSGAGYTIADLRDGYGDGGWWLRSHWLGRKGERPTLKHIRETVKEAVENSPRRAYARINAEREAAEALDDVDEDSEDSGGSVLSPVTEKPAGGHDSTGSPRSSP